MTRMISILIFTLAVGFGAFQNCQKSPQPEGTSSANSDGASAADGNSKIDLKNENVSEVHFLVQEAKTVSHGSGTYQLLVDKKFSISLPSGEMIVSTADENERRCLTETLTTQLLEILRSSQVCQAAKASLGNAQSEVACTLAIRSPYAVVVANNVSFNLGYASDGCGNNSVDLCGDQNLILREYINSIKENYTLLICP